MRIRLQASLDVKKNSSHQYEITSSFLRKRYQISSRISEFLLFLKDLQKGISYPQDLISFSKKQKISQRTLSTLISKLRKLNLLIEEQQPIPPPQETLYDRQIRFFRSYEKQTLSGETMQEELQNKTVVIVGLGGYGSWIALLLARMGVRHIIGVDFDNVDITNLHRQILYTQQNIGQPKVDACKEKIIECDPNINFRGYNLRVRKASDLHYIIKDVDLVLNPFSYLPPNKVANHPAGIIARASLNMKKPCLTFGGSWIGPLTLPLLTPCYFCALHTIPKSAHLDPNERNIHIQKRAFAPPISTCSSLAAFEAACFLSGCKKPQTLNGIMQIDINSFANNHFLSVTRSDSCSQCGIDLNKNMRYHES